MITNQKELEIIRKALLKYTGNDLPGVEYPPHSESCGWAKTPPESCTCGTQELIHNWNRRVVSVPAKDLIIGDHVLDPAWVDCTVIDMCKPEQDKISIRFDIPYVGGMGWVFNADDPIQLIIQPN